METFQIHLTALDILLVDEDKSHGATDGSFLAAALGATGAAAGPSHDQSIQKLSLGYHVALARANAKRMDSLAFQGVDTHICGCSVGEAAKAALGAVQEFLNENPNTSLRRILFMQYSRDAYEAFCSALRQFVGNS